MSRSGPSVPVRWRRRTMRRRSVGRCGRGSPSDSARRRRSASVSSTEGRGRPGARPGSWPGQTSTVHSSVARAWTPTSSRRSAGSPPAAAEPSCPPPAAHGVGDGQLPVNDSPERLTSRLPAWARGWSRRRILSAAAIVVLVVVVGVSCAGGAGGRSDIPVLADGTDAGVSGVRSPSDRAGGTLRVVASDVDSLAPQRSYLPGVWTLMGLYVRTLVTYKSEPGGTDGLVPDLATDLGTSSEDGLTWTFTLKQGVRFENGRPITSRDVKYGIERSFASDVIVGGPTYVVDLLDDPEDPYAGPYQDESDGKLGLASIATPDDRTIVFTLTAATPDFPFVMALPSSSPVPIESDTGAGYGAHPISSGPYTVASVDPQAGISLVRNPQWDAATDTVRTALPDAVLVRSGLSGVARDQALLAGSADADLSGTGVQQATTSRLDDEQLAGRIDDVTTGALRLLALPT